LASGIVQIRLLRHRQVSAFCNDLLLFKQCSVNAEYDPKEWVE
jgi:hypothetical protein